MDDNILTENPLTDEVLTDENLSLVADIGVVALRIVLILVATAVLVAIVKRWVPRTVDRIIESREQDESNFDEVRGSQENYAARQLSQERARQRARTLAVVAVSVLSIVVWFIGLLLVLGELEVELAPLLAGAGVAGVAIGFGAQQIIRDLLAGFFIVLEDQYGVGDIVDLGPAIGEVERITLRFTRLRDLEGRAWYIPNGEITRVGNYSKLWSRALIDVGIAYENDIERAGRAMVAAANAVREADDEEATIIEEPQLLGVEEFGPSSVVLRMLVKTEPGEQWVVGRKVRAEIKRRFNEEGIEIPFSQHDIRIRSEGVPAPEWVVSARGESDGPGADGVSSTGSDDGGSRRPSPDDRAEGDDRQADPAGATESER
jgi:small conductance mechanosensitive channel